MKSYIIIGLLSLLATATPGQGQDFEALVQKGMAVYDTVRDYTCLMDRTELLVNGKLKEQRGIVLKHRKPASFYLKWIEGTESLYVQGEHGDRLIVHFDNFFSFLNFSLEPAGKRAMKNNRHSVREAHLGFFLSMICENMERAKARGEGAIVYQGPGNLDGRPTLRFLAELPEAGGYYGGRIGIELDQELCLPVGIEVRGWDGTVWERYQFTKIRLNPGLDDANFDLNNPDYGFHGLRIYGL